MAEMKEVRHAGIGIQLNIGGLEEFHRLNDEIDKLMSKFQEFKSKVKGVDDGLNGLKSSKNNIIQISDYMKDMNKNLDKTKAPLKDINKGFNDISNASKDAKKDADLSAPIKKGKSAIDESKKSFLNLNGLIDKLPINKFKDLKEHISASKKATDESSKAVEKEKGLLDKMQERSTKFHDALRDSFFGSAISNGFSWVTGEIKSITKEGYELAAGGEQIRAQWKNIGLSDSNAHGMTDEIADIRGKSDMAGSSIDAMQKKFYALTGSVPKAKQLTDEISAFGSAAGKSGEQIQSIGMGVAKLTGSKTVSSGLFQRTFGQLPALQKAVVSASGMTQKAFTGALQGGKITGDQLQGYLSKAAKNSGKEWSAFGKTTRGQIAGLQGTFQNLKATFAAPMVSGISDALKDVSKQKGGLGDVKKQLTEIAKAIGTKVGNAIGDAIQFLVKNRKALADIGGALFTIVKNIGLGIWKAFADTIEKITGHSKDASGSLKGVSAALGSVAKHQAAWQTFGRTLAAALVTWKAFSIGSKGVKVGKSAFGIGEKIIGSKNKAGMFFKPKDGDKDAHEMTKFSKKLQSISGKMWSGIQKGSSKAISGIGKSFSKLGGFIKKLDSQFKIMNKIKIGAPWIIAIAAVIAIFVELYKHNKKFRNFVNGLLKWAKKFAKDFGKEFGKFFKATVKVVRELASNINKRWGNLWKDVINLFKDAWKIIKDVLRIFADVFTGNFKDLKKVIPKLVNDMWKFVKDYFKGAFDWLDDLTGGRLGRMIKAFANAWHDIGKGWKDFWNGIDDWFKNLWKGITKHVSNGINDIIDVLNGGIKGIDWVISKFGGSKSAIGKISHVHLATGTGVFGTQRRAITRPTMAMLNDGHDSPETGNREMLIHPNGMSELIKGINVTRMLEPGAEVLNASETRMAMGVEHFAGGSGLLSGIWNGAKKVASGAWNGVKSGASAVAGFASNAWSGATHLLSTIQKIIAHPVKYVESLIKKPTGPGEILTDFAGGFYSSMKKQAKSWWSELWSMASGALDESGGSSSMLDAMKKYGEGHSYVWGATGPTSFDCSGLVQYALEHAFGISYPRTSGAQISKARGVSSSDAKPGDLIGNGEHIGVYAGNGNYYSAMSETTHPNIGMSPVSTFPGTPHYGRVSGIPNDSSGKKATTSHGLQGLIKQETGGMLGWITKHLAPLLDTGDGGGPDGGSITHSMINEALETAHIPHKYWQQMQHDIVAVAKSETGNRNIKQTISDVNSQNGNPAGGPLQFTKTTFDAFAFPGHRNFHSSYDQVLAYLNNSQYASAAGNTVIWGTPKFDWLHSGPQGSKRYEKGGDVPDNQLSIVGEKGWELFKPRSGGHVFDHETSKKILSGGRGGNQKIEVHGATVQMTVNGNADSNTVSKLQSVMNDSNDALVDKLRQVLGLNDKGGLIV